MINRWMVGLIGIFLLLSRAENTTKAQTETKSYDIRMKYDGKKYLSPLVSLSINDSEPQWFLLDTGFTGNLLIAEKYASRFGLKPVETGQLLQPGNTKVKSASIASAVLLGTDGSTNVSLVPPGGEFKIVVAPVDVLGQIVSDTEVVGVVGAAVFEQISAKLDFSRQVLTVYLEPAPERDSRFSFIPVRFEADKYWLESKIGDVSVSLVLDTGSSGTSIPQKFILKTGKPVSRHNGTAFNAAGMTKVTSYFVDKMFVGKETVRVIEVDAHEMPLPLFDAALGMNVLERFDLLLDFPYKRIGLSRRKDYVEKEHLEGPGFARLQKTDDTLVVTEIKHPEMMSPVLKLGDILKKVDGLDVSGFSLSVGQHLLNGFYGQNSVVMVQRKNETLECKIVRPAFSMEALLKANKSSEAQKN